MNGRPETTSKGSVTPKAKINPLESNKLTQQAVSAKPLLPAFSTASSKLFPGLYHQLLCMIYMTPESVPYGHLVR